MYNLRVYTPQFEYGYTLELIVSLSIFLTVFSAIIIFIFNKYSVISNVSKFLARDKNLIDSNYTLGFESVEVSNELSVKKISATTKMVLTIFVFTFIFTPFSYFLPTLEYSNYFYGDIINTFLW